MDSYCETKFLKDFMDIYDADEEYDFTILFDDYFNQFISTNSAEFLKTVYQYYYDIDESKTLEELDEEDLHQHLYSLVEQMILNKCESDADMDVDE
jgi:hypothetical protein